MWHSNESYIHLGTRQSYAILDGLDIIFGFPSQTRPCLLCALTSMLLLYRQYNPRVQHDDEEVITASAQGTTLVEAFA